jgi:Secretion system C-terminal sorting domain
MKKLYFLLVALCFFIGVNSQIINFPDANFKAKLLAANTSNTIAKDLTGNYFKIDANNDGEIQVSESLNVIFLDVHLSSISNLIGIEYFLNLNSLSCEYNQLTNLNLNSNIFLNWLECSNNQLSNLNLNNNLALIILQCRNNQLISLNVNNIATLTTLICESNLLTTLNTNGNNELSILSCSNNQLSNLDVSNNNLLTNLSFYSNQLTTINLNNNTLLTGLGCALNQLSSLNLNNNSLLTFLNCSSNQLTALNISNNLALTQLNVENNQLTLLDLNSNSVLYSLFCGNNLLNSLLIKNGRHLDFLIMTPNPNLQYVCVDTNEFAFVQSILNYNGLSSTCSVSNYCSFTPGGPFYTIQGNNKYDQNNNGCDALDLPLSNLKFNITNGTVSGSLISNTTGSYSIPIQAGTNTITPILENPTYFTASPTTVNVTFPTQASPFTQNFCITANGIHPDLEVTLIPINAPRPGFDAKYKIIYKNKGNTTQSGNVNLVFNDAVLDLVIANPVITSQTINNLSWAFTNLLPFETREILVTLKVNSPTQTPAVSSGYVLNYNTTITSPVIDDMPNDNTFAYNQTVVNSFDPNDKTCLEGATITPTKVGDYVHYMIRFENNGTSNAQNIVVKDMIDLAKFDINSIIPVKGSHSFVTNITAGNKVEFIFENINLPFAAGTNGGFVAFKIKTKSTLVLGNTFANNASIYFDYNFPIVTNTATTTIAVLAKQDFEFSNYFSLYPNPVESVLNVSSKENIEITSINIYNTLGQLVLVIPNAQNTKTIDVSSLTSGNYFIKINSDKGTSNTKFIKK